MLHEIPAASVLPPQTVTPIVETPQPVAHQAVSSGADQNNYPTLTLELDPEIGIVVLQLRSESGRVELSIPTQQQLDAYRANPGAAAHNSGEASVA